MSRGIETNHKDSMLQLPNRAWRSITFRTRRYLEWRRLPDRVVRLNCQGFTLNIGNPKRTAIARSIYLKGEWEPDVTRYINDHVSPGMTALDVGAYFGFFTLHLAKLVQPQGKVYAFEIDPEILPLLYENIATNEVSNVDVFEVGLLDRSEELSLAGQGQLHFKGNPSSKAAIHVVAFDNWRLDKAIPQIDLIKIDIEGAELCALLGMQETLHQDGPQLLIEVHPQFMGRFNHRVSDLFDFLRKSGYDIYNGDGTRIEEGGDTEHIVCKKHSG